MGTCDILCYGEIGIDNIIQVDGLPSPGKALSSRIPTVITAVELLRTPRSGWRCWESVSS